MWIFPLIATFISALFSGAVLRQYGESRNPAHLAWAAALFIFAVATACDLIGSFSAWNPLVARVYYLTGATLVVGYLALGTLYLLASRKVAHAWLAVMAAVSVLAVVLLAGADVDQYALAHGNEPGWKAIEKPGILTAMAVSVNSAGTLILLGGAAYSAWRRRYPLANILIAAGTLIIAFGGTLTRFGRYEYQSIGQAVGIIVIFIGFLLTTKMARTPE